MPGTSSLEGGGVTDRLPGPWPGAGQSLAVPVAHVSSMLSEPADGPQGSVSLPGGSPQYQVPERGTVDDNFKTGSE